MIDDDPAQITAPSEASTSEIDTFFKALGVGAAVALAFAILLAIGNLQPFWTVYPAIVLVQAVVTVVAYIVIGAFSGAPPRLRRKTGRGKADAPSSEDGWSTYDIRLALESLDVPVLLLARRGPLGQVDVVARSRGARETIPACAAVVRSDWDILASALPE
ncbi:MAG: hypothetical protein D6824_08075, partial [Planctomycetota bacterium]